MSTAQAGIPVAVWGRDPSIVKAAAPLMEPDYDVVHAVVGDDLSNAIKELKALVSGDLSTAPSSGLGSNAERAEGERRVPRVIGCGGGISQEEYEKLRAGVGEGVAWIKITIEDVRATGHTGGPDPAVIGRVWRSKLKEAGF